MEFSLGKIGLPEIIARASIETGTRPPKKPGQALDYEVISFETILE